MKFKRIFVIVLDSLGVGEAMDAASYNDNGANTLKNIIEKYDLFVPNLKRLGLINTVIQPLNGNTNAYYTVAKPTNPGKDTLSGHYEMMGIKMDNSYKLYPNGFPSELINTIEHITKRKVMGNVRANKNTIIRELGEEEIREKGLIIYTTNDSTLNIAAHEKIVPVDLLYKYCEAIRRLTINNNYSIGRIIATPFVGANANSFKISQNRKDFTIDPPTQSVLNYLKDNNLSVISIGKIYDIFNGSGITKKISAQNNKEAIDKILDIMDKDFTGLCYANLNDFDSLYGHDRDLEGYATALEDFDVEIPLLLNKLNNDDLLIITADHGNDPTFKGNDHTRENVPVVVYSNIFKRPKKLPISNSFADIGATISDNFNVKTPIIGTSFLDKLE